MKVIQNYQRRREFLNTYEIELEYVSWITVIWYDLLEESSEIVIPI